MDQGFGQAPASKARAASDFNKDLSPNFTSGKKINLDGPMGLIMEDDDDIDNAEKKNTHHSVIVQHNNEQYSEDNDGQDKYDKLNGSDDQ